VDGGGGVHGEGKTLTGVDLNSYDLVTKGRGYKAGLVEYSWGRRVRGNSFC